jgi:hypothetical protein
MLQVEPPLTLFLYVKVGFETFMPIRDFLWHSLSSFIPKSYFWELENLSKKSQGFAGAPDPTRREQMKPNEQG